MKMNLSKCMWQCIIINDYFLNRIPPEENRTNVAGEVREADSSSYAIALQVEHLKWGW